jgi:hypothetical protein
MKIPIAAVTSRMGSATLCRVNADGSRPRVIGCEILRRVEPAELPGHSVNRRTDRVVLGPWSRQYLVPPVLDLFELGLVDTAGNYELLPVTADGKPLWDEVVHVLVTTAQAERQRGILMRSYRALHAMILEADELEASVVEWSGRGATHPVFGMLRLATIDVWTARRRRGEPLSEADLDVLHAAVARQVAAKIGAHVIR